MRHYLAGLGILIAAISSEASGAGPAALEAGSVWKNQRGSTMRITQLDQQTGAMSGNFVTAVGCGAGRERPLAGFFNQGALVFAVTFQECGSATAWTGTLNPAGDQITTLWHLARGGEAKWDSIIAGADQFTRQ
ncbi:MAG: hypothetical protein JOY71_01580 [Acetobacteraceae bacterium]|nr:hypothetical protein [Acetobacteraceae bacterium]MBV8520818.1 hypothetical protein [Acetobacteraceae bacterium]MBV8591815.1 hypothetical protein [Acetobacteraceae bacterium]